MSRSITSILKSCAAACAILAAQGTNAVADPVLAVCADPSNLPNSNDRQQGFENRIASLVAADLRAELRYTWNQQFRNFFRRTLKTGACDVVISVPASLPIVTTTKPYFTSTYVAVTRAADKRHFVSFNDPWLRDARIGLQVISADGANTPPAMSLANRGINSHITGFKMWANDTVANPQGQIIDAVAAGSIDAAFVWGPFAGYFAKSHGAALRIEPVTGDPAMPELAFAYPMAMGVRKGDTALRDRLQGALDRHPAEIAAILRDYGVPIARAPALAATNISYQVGAPKLTH